jgi:hypothetical protein
MNKCTRYAAVVVMFALELAAPAQEFFSEKIEPLLKRRCYECHSHQSGKMKGGLTLDSKSGWESGGDTSPAVVPGKPDASLLIKMVRWADDDHQMPPKKQLPAEEIALLEQWVQQGAPDPRTSPVKAQSDWWSLRPLGKPALPNTAVHPIDAFVQAQLRTKQLAPAPAADPRSLIRRLYFDLHGLPPSPEAVAAFVNEVNTQEPMTAYNAVVDKLLASPRYGERWARHWLDTVHFADTHGFEHDDLRPNAWRYRDYVIASLNRDTYWPRFIREQMAADVFFPTETALTAALGYLGAGTYDSSAAATAPTSFEYLDRDDLVTQTMASFVSTTANCARCHAHKFDPITQEDYFAIQAVFAGIGKGDVSYHDDPTVARQLRSLTKLKQAAERNDHAALKSPESTALIAAWEQAHAPAVTWETLLPETFLTAEGTVLERLPDGSLLASGPTPDKDTYTITTVTPLSDLTALRLDFLPDESLPAKGPGRASNGNLHLSEIEMQVFRRASSKAEKIALRRPLSDFDQVDYDVTKAIDGDFKSSWAIHPSIGLPHHGVFELSEKLHLETGTRIVITLRQLQGGSHLLGKFKLSATQSPASTLRALPASAEQILQLPAGDRTPEQQQTLASIVARLAASEALAKLPAPVSVWAASKAAKNERGVVSILQPRTIRLLKRGELSKPAEEIGPGALSAITALPARFDVNQSQDESSRRAAMADWLAHPENPLTWRSIVNRVWHYHFGKGICDTPSDFGHMGGVPSHPELLDWLAVWFRDEAHGSLKQLHRLIVTSSTYRQSSAGNAAALAVDPDNSQLWRMNRPRLDADTVRDSILAVSGNLDLTMGGPSVALFTSKPGPQTTPVLNYEDFDWNTPGANRRSIYRLVWRAIADPFMDTLDFPDLGQLSPVRSFSASALQSLAMFNNEFILHSSERLAAKLGQASPTPEGRIQATFQHSLQRDPTASELVDCTALAAQHGLAAVCRVLFNSNEFLFID